MNQGIWKLSSLSQGHKSYFADDTDKQMRCGWWEAGVWWHWFPALASDCWIPGALHSLNSLSYFPLYKPTFCLISLRWFSFVCSWKDLFLVIHLLVFSFMNLVINVFNKDLLTIKHHCCITKNLINLCSWFPGGSFYTLGSSVFDIHNGPLGTTPEFVLRTWFWMEVGPSRETNFVIIELGFEWSDVGLTFSREGGDCITWPVMQSIIST